MKDEPAGVITRNITTHRCPLNYNGSAKSMEAAGAVAMTTAMYNGGNAYISVLVGDDNSTVFSNLRHSFQALMTANGWTNKAQHWPKTQSGKSYVADNGKLPLHVKAIDRFLADPAHCGKSFGRALYLLEKKRGRELKFTSVDCERLKRNFNFWQRQNKSHTYEIFKMRYRAVLDHHFGHHTSCQSKEEGGWCKFKGRQDLIDEAKKQNRYRNKDEDVKTYELVLKIWEHFGSDLMLEQVFHKFMSQKSESLHQQMSKVAPKDMHFSSSMSLSDRVVLVVVMDSVGYEEGMKLIFDEVGLELPDVTVQYLILRNERRRYDTLYHQHLEVKNHCHATKKENIKKDLEQKAKDAQMGMDYGSSCEIGDVADAVEESEEHGNSNSPDKTSKEVNKPPKKQRTLCKDLVCKNCSEKRHGTWKSKACEKHKEYLAQRGKLYV